MYSNNLPIIRNRLVNDYVITTEDENWEIVKHLVDSIGVTESRFNFEHLIELFEFVISPTEKIVNGAVYTPEYIRNYIINRVIPDNVGILTDYRFADIACGCGGFLLTAARKIKELSGKSFQDIFEFHLYGVDITAYSIDRAKLLLTLYAIYNGEDLDLFTFNLFIGNSLSLNWSEVLEKPDFHGFDAICGNPPYVASRNMDDETIQLLDRWEVTSTGHPDLYIPFFQIGYENLNPTGLMGIITVNTFIKSVNGRALRQYFPVNNVDLEIINFGGEQLFPERNTYTCICFLTHNGLGVRYVKCSSYSIKDLTAGDFTYYPYNHLHAVDGWNLANSIELSKFISQVESVGTPFKELYETKNGIATLKNHVYKFKPFDEDDEFYYFRAKKEDYKVEKIICRDIVNANKLRVEIDIVDKLEKLIFPYSIVNGKVTIIPEEVLSVEYPFTYSYLKSNKALLATRDKSKRSYEAWYAYGRKQSMDVKGYKLFFPHICERPRFVLSQNLDLLFYNGIAIVSDNEQDLMVLKRILESDLFYKYIKNTTKDYASGYISMSRNYLKNFGICKFSDEEKNHFLTSDRTEEILHQKYGTY